MSIGNLKTQGNQGKNFPFQLAVLKLLGKIAGDDGCGTPSPSVGNCCPTAATEATLNSILTALQNGQEYEQNLVTDLGGVGCPGNCPTYLQVRIWNDVTHTFNAPIYYTAAGVLVVPVGPVELVNPQFVLTSLLAQDTAIAGSVASIDTKTPALGQALAASSVPVVLTAAQLITLTPPVAITGFALETGGHLASIDTKLPSQGQALAAASIPVVLTAAQLITLTPPAAIIGFATSVKQSDGTQKTQVVDSTNTEVFTPITRTPSFLRVSGAGLVTIPAGARAISFLNSGLGNVNVDGNVLKPGEEINMEAGAQRDILAAITYDPLTSELLIVKVV